MPWDLSCKDWEARLACGMSLIPELPLDNVAADKALALFNRLRLADVPGSPRMEDAAGDWFKDIIRVLFGSWDEKESVRYVREIFVLVGKKNSKTSYSAILMLVALLRNKRPNAKFLLVAPTQDTADLAFSQAAGAVRLDEPEHTGDGKLGDLIDIQDYRKTLVHRVNGATLEIMSFDPKALTGQKPTGFLLDELHVVSGSHTADRAVGQLRGGMISQAEAFGIITTTQSEKAPTGVFEAELRRARKIRDGFIKGYTLPVLYEFPREIASNQERWQDPSTWYRVLPNLGRPVTLERLVEEFADAQSRGPRETARWASQHLNVEIGVGLPGDNWPGAEFWEKASDDTITLDSLIERCDVITAGIDGGGLDDLLGFALVGREKGTRRWVGWCQALVHTVALERRKGNQGAYDTFVEDGDLVVVEGEYTNDLKGVNDVLVRVMAEGKLAGVGLDQIGLRQAVESLASIGVTQDAGLLHAIGQGIKLGSAGKALERKLVDGTFVHARQRLMDWCVGNVVVRATSTAIIYDKALSGYGKIDPLIALFNAVELMSTNPEPPDSLKSAYEDEEEGFLLL